MTGEESAANALEDEAGFSKGLESGPPPCLRSSQPATRLHPETNGVVIPALRGEPERTLIVIMQLSSWKLRSELTLACSGFVLKPTGTLWSLSQHNGKRCGQPTLLTLQQQFRTQHSEVQHSEGLPIVLRFSNVSGRLFLPAILLPCHAVLSLINLQYA
jgi:hypothetical protein